MDPKWISLSPIIPRRANDQTLNLNFLGLDKKAKVAAADTIVKLMVPFFKSGKIGNKQVFKFTAKEFTHALLECNRTHLTSYPKYVDKFFAKSGVLNTEDDAKNKINSFRRALVSK